MHSSSIHPIICACKAEMAIQHPQSLGGATPQPDQALSHVPPNYAKSVTATRSVTCVPQYAMIETGTVMRVPLMQ
jgi:hypothetical protein